MADFQNRPGSGALFRNETDNPKAPAYKGELCLEDGRMIRLAGWVKEGRKGKFLSLSIDKPREDDRPSGGTGSSAPRETFTGDIDDPIPFISVGER